MIETVVLSTGMWLVFQRRNLEYICANTFLKKLSTMVTKMYFVKICNFKVIPERRKGLSTVLLKNIQCSSTFGISWKIQLLFKHIPTFNTNHKRKKILLAKKTISLTKTSMIFDFWRRKKILLTKIVMKITLERKILENYIGKENNIIDKNVNDIWLLKGKKIILTKH